jgi:muramoyltetrapeptide carboxypeptidase
MIIPPYLKNGDKICIVAPARKISPQEVEAAKEILNSAGFEVVYGKNLFGESNQFSGTEEERAEDLQFALDDDSVKAILMARGGYGTLRVIDQLDFSRFKKSPKWICGYSDVTVLHSHIHSNFNVATIHGTMPINFLKNEEATSSLIHALKGNYKGISDTRNFNVQAPNREGEAQGVLVGGNLSLLYALNGSISDIDTNGKILIIEDLDEYLYHVDRMMLCLKRAGKLSGLKGLIVGGMTEMKDNTIPFGKTAEEIIMDAVAEYNYPVAFEFSCGHIDRNLAVYLGREVFLRIDSNGLEINYS